MEQTPFIQLNKPSSTGNLDFANDDRFWKENPDKIDAAIQNLNDIARFTPLGQNAVVAKDSVYLLNDANLFGYLSDGTHANLATMEDSDVARLGDTNAVTWLMAKNYLSIRAPKAEIVEQVDSGYNAVSTPRTIYHQGNATYHAMFQTDGGTQILTQGANNKLNLLDDVVSSFPAGNATSGTGKFTVGRSGVYVVNYTVRPTAVTNTISVIRMGMTKVSSGVTTEITMQDILATSSYATGFYGGTFIAKLAKDDTIQPWINPLSEQITAQSGTKFNVYYLGDTPAP